MFFFTVYEEENDGEWTMWKIVCLILIYLERNKKKFQIYFQFKISVLRIQSLSTKFFNDVKIKAAAVC